MALALVVVAQQIITSGMISVSDQALWLGKFVARSFYWVLVGVVESVIIGFLFYLREDKAAKDEEKLKQLGAPPQEVEPLSMETIEEPKPNETDTEVSSWKFVIYKMKLRTMDMIALAICAISYTVFIIFMFTSVNTSYWLRSEPIWFEENIDGDPEN